VGYLFFVSLATVVRASNYWALLNHVATIVTFCMLLELSLRDSPEFTLDMLFYPLTVLILANFVLLLLYPDGICTGGTYYYSYNLMGIDNMLAPVLIPYMFLTALRSTMLYGDLDLIAYLMIGISALTLLLVWSATGLMGLAVALIFLLFFYQRRWQTLFNGVTSMVAGFGLFFSVVLFRLQNLFSFLIEGILHKGLSFTGRTDIWDTAISQFLASPFLGYGYAQSGKVYRLKKGKYYHAHNVFLELLMEGGVFALICFLLMLGLSSDQLMRHRKHPYACLISAGLMAGAVMTTMEPFLDSSGLMLYALVFLGYHVGTLISHTNAKNSLSLS
jgi:O-antigen ligase